MKKPPSKALSVALWIVQSVLALLLAPTGVWKLLTPASELATQFPWMGEVSPAFLHLTAVADLAGGLGILLPSLTRIRPGLVVPAALGCAVLMASAIVFHLSRGEASNTPFNFIVLALAVFVAWGRRRAPVPARG